MREPVRVIRPLQILRHFRAEKSLRHRMVRIARDANGAAILDRDEHQAGVRTIVRTDGADDFGHARKVYPARRRRVSVRTQQQLRDHREKVSGDVIGGGLWDACSKSVILRSYLWWNIVGFIRQSEILKWIGRINGPDASGSKVQRRTFVARNENSRGSPPVRQTPTTFPAEMNNSILASVFLPTRPAGASYESPRYHGDICV